jgi:hypothetical protein
MDKECVALCAAMNRMKGIRTTSSCCGHGKNPYRIYFQPRSLAALPPLLFWFDGCHCGFYGWTVVVYTDCSAGGPFFLVEGPTGPEAYAEAESIASLLTGEAEADDKK